MRLIWSFLLAIACSAGAQPVWRGGDWNNPKGHVLYPSLERVSVREMQEGFYAAFSGGSPSLPRHCDLKGMANLLVGKDVLSACPSPDDVAEMQGWWVEEEVEDEKGDCTRYLTLHALNSYSGDSVAAQEAYHRLLRTYGVGSYLPATWYTGLVGELKMPVRYMGFIVSPYLSFMQVRQGVVSRRSLYLDYQNVTYSDEAQKLRMVFDGHWVDRTDDEHIFLTHDVNRAWRESGRDTVMCGEGKFSLLLVTGEDGRITVHPLLPENLTVEQEGLLAGLQDAMNTLPAWCLCDLYTSDGRIFPGRYVHAAYSSRGAWTLIDYFRFDPKVKGGLKDLSPLSAFRKDRLIWVKNF